MRELCYVSVTAELQTYDLFVTPLQQVLILWLFYGGCIAYT